MVLSAQKKELKIGKVYAGLDLSGGPVARGPRHSDFRKSPLK